MINFREIFNSSYSVVGLVIIVILLIILFLLEDGVGDFLLNIGVIGIVTGIISLSLGGIVFLVLNFLPHSYKVFVSVISDNVVKGIFSSSILVLILGVFLYLISLFLFKKGKEENA